MARSNEQNGNASGETMTTSSKKDDRLTAEQIEVLRVLILPEWDERSVSDTKLIAELNALCDLALSALRQDSSGGEPDAQSVGEMVKQLRVRISENCTNEEALATIDALLEKLGGQRERK